MKWDCFTYLFKRASTWVLILW